MSAWSLVRPVIFALLFCSCFLGVALRTEVEMDAADEMKEHAAGLEEEHGSAPRWPVTKQDESILAEIIEMLNPKSRDSDWIWDESALNEVKGWTFGMVMLTAKAPTEALALHMLHRHGLAPLLASRAGQTFEQFFATRVQTAASPTGISKVSVLVQSEEEQADVLKLKRLLEALSPGGIRNLHSFDHQWSVQTGTGKVPGCKQSNAESCVLQAGLSAQANSFLRRHGLTRDVCRDIINEQKALINKIWGGYEHLSERFRTAFLTKKHFAQKAFDGEVKDGVLRGWVAWESGARSPIEFSVSTNDQAALNNGDITALQLVEKWIEGQTSTHKSYMMQHRLTLWSGEECEFVGMHDLLPRQAEEGDVPAECPRSLRGCQQLKETPLLLPPEAATFFKLVLGAEWADQTEVKSDGWGAVGNQEATAWQGGEATNALWGLTVKYKYDCEEGDVEETWSFSGHGILKKVNFPKITSSSRDGMC